MASLFLFSVRLYHLLRYKLVIVCVAKLLSEAFKVSFITCLFQNNNELWSMGFQVIIFYFFIITDKVKLDPRWYISDWKKLLQIALCRFSMEVTCLQKYIYLLKKSINKIHQKIHGKTKIKEKDFFMMSWFRWVGWWCEVL